MQIIYKNIEFVTLLLYNGDGEENVISRLYKKRIQTKDEIIMGILKTITEEYFGKIIREEDGLAKSSRNTYLSPEERKAAVILSKSLKLGKEAIEAGERDCKKIIDIITNNINTEKLAKIDYVEIVDPLSIENIDKIENSALVAMAVYIGKTRLIDNFIYEV